MNHIKKIVNNFEISLFVSSFLLETLANISIKKLKSRVTASDLLDAMNLLEKNNIYTTSKFSSHHISALIDFLEISIEENKKVRKMLRDFENTEIGKEVIKRYNEPLSGLYCDLVLHKDDAPRGLGMTNGLWEIPGIVSYSLEREEVKIAVKELLSNQLI
jgi:hypothetical protein